MASPPDSIAILQFMLKAIKAKKVVEVGVFTGYMTLGMALALPRDGKIKALDIEEEYVSVGRPFWKQAGVDKLVDVTIGPASHSLDQLIEAEGPDSYDLGFIDADKENYRAYYEKVLKLLRPGGIIVVDNVLWHGAVADDSVQDEETKAIRALNEFISTDERVSICMLKNSDGITLALKH